MILRRATDELLPENISDSATLASRIHDASNSERCDFVQVSALVEIYLNNIRRKNTGKDMDGSGEMPHAA
jgi:hypothetical protein